MKLSQLALIAPLTLLPALALLQKALFSSDSDESEALQLSENISAARSTELRAAVRLSPLTLQFLNVEQRKSATNYLNLLISAEPENRAWHCLHPDTDPALLNAYHEAEVLAGMHGSAEQSQDTPNAARQFLNLARWSNTALSGSTGDRGTPAIVTWSVVPDGTIVPNGTILPDGTRGTASSNFQRWMGQLYGNSASIVVEDQIWFEVLEQGFEDLSDESGITFVYEPNDDGIVMSPNNSGVQNIRGDIRIAGTDIDGNSGTLAFAFAPNYGDTVFDTADSFFQNTSANSLGFHNVLTHEVGHAIGLAHVCPIDESKLMEPFINRGFRGPQFDTRYSLHRQYGDPSEARGDLLNNDTAANATLLTLTRDQELTETNLSIDGSNDVDFFAFDGIQFEGLSVRVNPDAFNQEAYPEGSQNDDGSCSAGALFDPNTIHNLVLELIGPDGSTSLMTTDSQGFGEAESFDEFFLPDDGRYFIKVSGSTANDTQRYALSVTLDTPAPITNIAMSALEQIEESGTVRNGIPDANETIRLSIELSNEGLLVANELTASLETTEGVTIFSGEANYGNLSMSTPVSREFIVGLNSDCGDSLALTLALTDDNGFTQNLPVTLALGEVRTESTTTTNFDASSDLPDGWTTTSTSGQPAWVVSDTSTISAPNAVFGAATARTNTAILMSPELAIPGGGQVSFTHSYNLEQFFDGGALEFSLDGGEWLDLVDAPGARVREGNYTTRMSSTTGTPLSGRRAWSGNSFTSVRTTVDFPGDWRNRTVRLRWLMAHNRSGRRIGWTIDDIIIVINSSVCEPHIPQLDFSITDTDITEGQGGAMITVTTPLPLTQGLNFSISPVDSTAVDDFAPGALNNTLPAGETSFTFQLPALLDQVEEGTETVSLALDLTGGNFITTTPTAIDVNITDGIISEFTLWAEGFSVTDPTADDDSDGRSNLAEYLLNSDPTEPSPPFTVRLEPTTFDIVTGPLPDRTDATLGVESSPDLITWTPVTVTPLADGLALDRDADTLYYRLTFSLTSDE